MSTAEAKNWFDVDRKGLAKLIERRGGGGGGKIWLLYELLANAWDADGTTTVDVSLVPEDNVPKANIVVTDDSPDGFANLSHAWTLFAESNRKGDAGKRGRFNLGEKLVLALCDEASIVTTSAGVMFDSRGRTTTKKRRDRGSEFYGIARITRAELVEIEEGLKKLIPPHYIKTVINGMVLPTRAPIATIEATLPTEIADGDGVLRRSARKCQVEIYEPLAGEVAMLYEMGIPVVETGDKWHVNVCLAPSTKILTADLRYARADSIVTGDKLVGFDEERDGARRRFRNAQVKNVARLRLPCYRLTFDDGTQVVCSSDHQWLCTKGRDVSSDRKGRTSRWVRAEDMVPTKGKRQGSVVAKPLDVWPTGTTYTDGYLAAAFDGEGSLTHTTKTRPAGAGTQLVYVQCFNAMLDRTETALREAGIEYTKTRRERKNEAHSPIATLRIGERRDALKLLGMCRPQRLLPKLDIDKLGTLPTGRGVRLVEKEFLGEQEVIAIETSTRTFIAEGLASHNCQKVPLNMDRDNVTPAYLREIRTLVVNELHSRLTPEDAAKTFVNEALADADASPEAVNRALDLKYGEKRAIWDPSDLEANMNLQSQGYTLMKGAQLTSEQWTNVRKHGAAVAAGRIAPTRVAHFSPDGKDVWVPEDKWTPSMQLVADYSRDLGHELLGEHITVSILSDVTLDYGACFGDQGLVFNLGRLGHKFFNAGITDELNALLIHEFGHHIQMNHLDKRFHDALCKLGAKLARLALTKPEFFKRWGRD